MNDLTFAVEPAVGTGESRWSPAIRAPKRRLNWQAPQQVQPMTVDSIAKSGARSHVAASTFRVWEPYIRLLVHGSPEIINGRTLPAFGQRWMHEISVDDLESALEYVRDRAVRNAAQRTATPGRTARMPDGYGAVRTAVGAWRHLFRVAVAAGGVHRDLDPAAQLRNPRPEHFLGQA